MRHSRFTIGPSTIAPPDKMELMEPAAIRTDNLSRIYQKPRKRRWWGSSRDRRTDRVCGPRLRFARSPTRRALRPARTERRGQDDTHQDPHDSARPLGRLGPGRWPRRGRRGRGDSPAHQHGLRRRVVAATASSTSARTSGSSPASTACPTAIAHERIDRMLGVVGLTDKAKSRISHLSTGPAAEDELLPRLHHRSQDPLPR